MSFIIQIEYEGWLILRCNRVHNDSLKCLILVLNESKVAFWIVRVQYHEHSKDILLFMEYCGVKIWSLQFYEVLAFNLVTLLCVTVYHKYPKSMWLNPAKSFSFQDSIKHWNRHSKKNQQMELLFWPQTNWPIRSELIESYSSTKFSLLWFWGQSY